MQVILFGAIYDALPLIPLAIGLVWTLRYQKVADLSLAGSFAISAGVAAFLLHSGVSAFLSLCCGILVGLILGMLMSLSINVLRIDALMAGLIILFIGYAISLGITQGTVTIPNENNPLELLLAIERGGSMPVWMHPWINLLFMSISVLVVLTTHVLLRSEWGCAFRALEDQESGRTFLRSLGIRSGWLSSAGFVVAASLASFSGIMTALRDGQATTSFGLDSLIEIIPAYLLGISLFEKKPSLQKRWNRQSRSSWGHYLLAILSCGFSNFRIAPASVAAAIGVLIFFMIVNAAQKWTGVPWLPRVVIGITILGVLGVRPALNTWRQGNRQRKATQIRDYNTNLEISGLSVNYATIDGLKVVLQNINLVASPGEVILLQGPNGCGKTTLLRALIDNIDSHGNFRIPTRLVDGRNSNRSNRACIIGYVPQDASSCTARSLSVEEHAALAWCGRDISPFRSWHRAAAKGVPLLGVADVTQDPSALLKWLSGGQVRRVLLGLLKARRDKPVVVAMDEPYSHLDRAGQYHCTKVISTLAKSGSIVLLVDHGVHIEPTRRFEDHWDGEVLQKK